MGAAGRHARRHMWQSYIPHHTTCHAYLCLLWHTVCLLWIDEAKSNIKPIYECRCNGRLQTKRFTRLSHTVFLVLLLPKTDRCDTVDVSVPPSRRSTPDISRFHPVPGWRTILHPLARRVQAHRQQSSPTQSPLWLLLLVRLGGYIVNSLDCYSYRIIGKLTAFLQLQEFSFRNLPVDSSTSSVWCSLHNLKQKSEVPSSKLHLSVLTLHWRDSYHFKNTYCETCRFLSFSI
jgi:hypothetical protein